MCGRYSLDTNINNLINRYNVVEGGVDFSPTDEIFPTNVVPVIINKGKNKVKLMKWGFMPDFAKRPIINARSETVDEKVTFKYSFYNRRCIIPATSFYEWEKVEDKKVKRRIKTKNIELLSLAGIYSVFKNKEGKYYEAFTILTRNSLGEMRNIHHRMPIVIPREKEGLWLNPNIRDGKMLKEAFNSFNYNFVIEKGE